MAPSNVVFMAEVDHLFGFEGNSIVSDDFFQAAKSRQDVAFKELDDGGVIGLPTRDGFDPFGEIVGGCQNPFLLA